VVISPRKPLVKLGLNVITEG